MTTTTTLLEAIAALSKAAEYRRNRAQGHA